MSATKPFVTVWDTELTSIGSSNNNQIKLPLVSSGEYEFIIDWGDGTSELITNWNDGIHTYDNPGKYLVAIRGLITGWSFNNTGDKLKVLNIFNWGNLKLTNDGGYFYGCSNLTIFVEDIVNTVDCTNFSNFFRDCTNLTTIKGIKFLNTSSAITMEGMFQNSRFNGDISNWNLTTVNNFSNFLTDNSNFNIINYDKFLNSLAEQSTSTNGVLDAPLTNYSVNSETNRTNLIQSGWTITDAGLAI